ncbi:MAG: T9SS type A sorting domain-containing protein [Bacteroidetes bacterium]|nr:MAG: T9SS type A sorting domain-containing protein [Bacteroidota bacterium]
MKRKLLTLLMITSAYVLNAQVVFNVTAPADISGNYGLTYAQPGTWGVGDLLDPANSVTDTLMLVDDGTAADSLGCNPLVNNLTGKIAVVYRGDCEFGTKSFNAQTAGAVAVVIINNVPGDPVGMAGGTDGPNVAIPVVMISQLDGALLRARLEAGEDVVAFIGNKNGLFEFDLSLRDDRILVPSPVTNHSLFTQNGGEYTFRIGSWIYNDGTIGQGASSLSAKITYAGNELYSEAQNNIAIASGDSVYVEFAPFTSSAYLSGEYTLTYTLNGDAGDDYASDNVKTFGFHISDFVYSYVPLNDEGLPASTTGYRPSATTSTFSACMHFRDANAGRAKAEGIYFAATTNADAELNGQEFIINGYRWNDDFTDLNDPNAAMDQLEEVGTGIYQYTQDSMDFETVYAKFDQSFDLEDNQRYLFCVTTYDPNTFIGYGPDDFSWVIDTVLQPLFPIQTDQGFGIIGFGGEPTAIAVKLSSSSPIPVITASGYTNICQGESVTLTSSVSDGNLWSNGQGTQSITVSQSGTYSVTVGGNVSNEITIVVNEYPAAPSITATSRVVCPGGDVTLTSSAAGDNVWSNGETTQAITVSSAGVYTVSASNNGCMTTSDPVKITEFMAPVISAGGDVNFCEGGSVVLTSSYASGNAWSNGETTQSILVNASGTYSCETSLDGCSATSNEIVVTATAAPVVSINALTAPSVCGLADGSFEVSGTATGDLTYTINGSSTTLSGITLPYSYANAGAGTYVITFTDGNGCTSNATSAVVNDPTATSPTISVTGNTALCEGDSVILTSSATGGNTWSNGATTDAITVKSAGTYSVAVDNGGCISSSDAVSVSLNAAPTAVNAGPDLTICAGQEITLEASGAVSYAWTNGASNAVAFVPSMDGAYVVTGTDFNGCSATDTMMLTINALPNVSAGDDTKACLGTLVTLSASGADTYTWNNGIVNGQPFVATITSNFIVTGVTADGCANTDTITVTVHDLPNVTYVEATDTTCYYYETTLSAGSPALGVYSGAGVTNGADGATFNPWAAGFEPGIYTIVYTATDANGCSGSAAQSIVADGCASVDEINQLEISIYPNPANTTLNIASEQLERFETIELTDQFGRVIQTWSVKGSFMNLNVDQVSVGNYHLVFKGADAKYIQKVQINH